MINVVFDSQWLSSLMSCVLMGHYRFDECLEPIGGKSNSLECGSLAHVIREHYDKAIIRGASRPDAILAGFAAGREYIVPYQASNTYIKDETHPGLQNTPEDNEKKNENEDGQAKIGWKWVFTTMEQYFDFWRNDSWISLEAESVKREVIYQDDEIRVMWCAKFDRIAENPEQIIPVDMKTSKQRRTAMELNNQFMGQCILLKSRNMLIDKVGFQTSLKPHEKFDRQIISYSSDRLDEWQNVIVPHYARMYIAYKDANYYPPNFTHCENKYGRCIYYKDICNSDRSMREIHKLKLFRKGKVWDIANDVEER